ncbi:MAG: flavodoxin-dependent (E)-4-hydroxy-3-methylbut-2-enyl-diphosphate synthase [Planctomycetaceae bacterium]|nr:flavodoxin-dependent (E)-4-hydroxy-3-methylbut-2-enyl-diphosphate synthase [Planctomycetaceae bacterium]
MTQSAFPTPRNPTRPVKIGSVVIGGGHPVVVQSMCATKTANVEATVAQVEQLAATGAGVVRIAVDTKRDCEALAEIRRRTNANLSVDLQENYRLAADVAPLVDKIRYNPGHLYHHEPERSWQDKVRFLVDVAGQHDCALRVGVNCGSVDPAKTTSPRPLAGDPAKTTSPRPLAGEGPGVRAASESIARRVRSESPLFADTNIKPLPVNPQVQAMLDSALEHCELLDRLGFTRYCVSLKDSDPARVVEVNRRFAAVRPDVPLHLGVTEAGLPPEGILKTRAAIVPLLAAGIGDTLRVSLTVPAGRKREEVEAGRQILANVAAGRLSDEDSAAAARPLNIISCPSCSRVENEAFVELAEQVRDATRYAADYPITIAVMGCRVNGPGETDHADLGLWCGPDAVHLKRGSTPLGVFPYDQVIPRLKAELDALIAGR